MLKLSRISATIVPRNSILMKSHFKVYLVASFISFFIQGSISSASDPISSFGIQETSDQFVFSVSHTAIPLWNHSPYPVKTVTFAFAKKDCSANLDCSSPDLLNVKEIHITGNEDVHQAWLELHPNRSRQNGFTLKIKATSQKEYKIELQK